MDLLATDLAGKLKVVKIDTEQYPTFGTSRLSAPLLPPDCLDAVAGTVSVWVRRHASLLVRLVALGCRLTRQLWRVVMLYLMG